MSSEHEEKHLHIHLPPGLMQSAYIASSPTYFDSREEQLRQIRTRQVEKSTDFSKKKRLSWKVLVAMLQNVGQLITCYHFTTFFYPREQNT